MQMFGYSLVCTHQDQRGYGSTGTVFHISRPGGPIYLSWIIKPAKQSTSYQSEIHYFYLGYIVLECICKNVSLL
jgi:hypothetical protein